LVQATFTQMNYMLYDSASNALLDTAVWLKQ